MLTRLPPDNSQGLSTIVMQMHAARLACNAGTSLGHAWCCSQLNADTSLDGMQRSCFTQGVQPFATTSNIQAACMLQHQNQSPSNDRQPKTQPTARQSTVTVVQQNPAIHSSHPYVGCA